MGKVIKLTARLRITVGKVVNVSLHPSGQRFDGPARVTDAFFTNGRPIVLLVSLADPTNRIVSRAAADFAD